MIGSVLNPDLPTCSLYTLVCHFPFIPSIRASHGWMLGPWGPVVSKQNTGANAKASWFFRGARALAP